MLHFVQTEKKLFLKIKCWIAVMFFVRLTVKNDQLNIRSDEKDRVAK